MAHLFIEAVRTLMALQDREIAEVARDGVGLQRFGLALELARRNRDRAKRIYLLHVQQHGC